MDHETRILDKFDEYNKKNKVSYPVKFGPNLLLNNKFTNLFGLLSTGTITEITEKLESMLCSPYIFHPEKDTGRRTIINGPALEVSFSLGGCQMKHLFGIILILSLN